MEEVRKDAPRRRGIPVGQVEVRSNVRTWVRDALRIRAQRNASSIGTQAAKILETFLLNEQYEQGRIRDRRSRAA